MDSSNQKVVPKQNAFFHLKRFQCDYFAQLFSDCITHIHIQLNKHFNFELI